MTPPITDTHSLEFRSIIIYRGSFFPIQFEARHLCFVSNKLCCCISWLSREKHFFFFFAYFLLITTGLSSCYMGKTLSIFQLQISIFGRFGIHLLKVRSGCQHSEWRSSQTLGAFHNIPQSIFFNFWVFLPHVNKVEEASFFRQKGLDITRVSILS